jgi:hypothetical protein
MNMVHFYQKKYFSIQKWGVVRKERGIPTDSRGRVGRKEKESLNRKEQEGKNPLRKVFFFKKKKEKTKKENFLLI